MSKMSRSELIKAIDEMDSVYSDSTTPDHVKKSLKPSIENAKAMLAAMPATGKSKSPKAHIEKAKSIVAKKHPVAASTKKPKKISQADINKAVAAAQKIRKSQGLSSSKANVLKDAKRMAMKPGTRVSKEGNVYVEKRENRSDRSGIKFPRLEKGGAVQGPPQGDNYSAAADKHERAKPSGMRRKGDGPHAYQAPSAKFIADNPDQVYYENRRDKSDKVPKKFYEYGGEVGKNISVFGYETKHFDMCPAAAAQFEVAEATIRNLHQNVEDAFFKKMSVALASLAEAIDRILGIEAMGDYRGEDVINVVHLLQIVGVYNFKSGLTVDTSFLTPHVANIMHNSTELYELGGETTTMIGDPTADFRFNIHSPLFEAGGTV